MNLIHNHILVGGCLFLHQLMLSIPLKLVPMMNGIEVYGDMQKRHNPHMKQLFNWS